MKFKSTTTICAVTVALISIAALTIHAQQSTAPKTKSGAADRTLPTERSHSTKNRSLSPQPVRVGTKLQTEIRAAKRNSRRQSLRS